MGVAVFYGYPFSYISVDSSSLFSVLIKSLIALLFAFAMIKTAMKSSQGAIWNTFLILVSMVALSIKMYFESKGMYGAFTIFCFNLVILFTFPIAESIKKINNYSGEDVQRRGLFKAVFYSWVFCFCVGNYYYNFSPDGLYQDKDGRIIIAQYNDKYLMKKCQGDGSMNTYIADIPDGELTPAPKKYFDREFLKAECNLDSSTHDKKVD